MSVGFQIAPISAFFRSLPSIRKFRNRSSSLYFWLCDFSHWVKTICDIAFDKYSNQLLYLADCQQQQTTIDWFRSKYVCYVFPHLLPQRPISITFDVDADYS